MTPVADVFKRAADLTSAEIAILRHTLGMVGRRASYRNYFNAEEGHSDMPTLESLVAKGFMDRTRFWHTPGDMFRATEAGVNALALAERTDHDA